MDTHSLAGRRIVITRPEPQAARLAERLRELGATPIIAPAIEIEFTDPPPLDAALAHLQDYHWIVFTSRNGVEAVFRRLAPHALTPDTRHPTPRIAAIGPATADALRRRGVTPDLVPERYVAEAVLDALGDVTGQRILLPRADIARKALPEGLRARGAIVDEIAAYRTKAAAGSAEGAATAARTSMGGVDAITFTSSSTVRGFLEREPVPEGAKVICIGPITAATAREYGLEITAVAEEYTEDGLIAALVAALARDPR